MVPQILGSTWEIKWCSDLSFVTASERNKERNLERSGVPSVQSSSEKREMVTGFLPLDFLISPSPSTQFLVDVCWCLSPKGVKLFPRLFQRNPTSKGLSWTGWSLLVSPNSGCSVIPSIPFHSISSSCLVWFSCCIFPQFLEGDTQGKTPALQTHACNKPGFFRTLFLKNPF